MNDTERLNAIIKETETRLGCGWWWDVTHDLHLNALKPANERQEPRAIIDAQLNK